eukprot:Clim_evm12s78 gene=Clim_evmTU12s78
MHGRKKVPAPTDPEVLKQRKEKSLARAQQIEALCKATVDIRRTLKESAGDGLEEADLTRALTVTQTLLQVNPDFATAWNIRREVVLRKVKTSHGVLDDELEVALNGIRHNPKSYCSWFHRRWSIEQKIKVIDADNKDTDGHLGEVGTSTVKELLNTEMGLCDDFLKMDGRNFHCWDHRRWVARQMKERDDPRGTDVSELGVTGTLLAANFSNYSAWHYRSHLLPAVLKEGAKTAKQASDSLPLQALKDELELVRNAFYTEPDDSSAWLYHQWLLQTTVLGSDATTNGHDIEKLLREEITHIQELLNMEAEAAAVAKWCHLGLIRTQGLLVAWIRRCNLAHADVEEREGVIRVREWANALQETDTLRAGYWKEFVNRLDTEPLALVAGMVESC